MNSKGNHQLKERKWFVVLILVLVIVFFVIGNYINDDVRNSVRYATIEEAFYASAPEESSLLEIIESKDIAVVYYGYAADTVHLTYNIIGKDENGWEPVTLQHKVSHAKMLDAGFLQTYEVYGKTAVLFWTRGEFGEIAPTVSDSEDSRFLNVSHEHGTNLGIAHFSFVVFEEGLPPNYMVTVNGESVVLS